METTVFISSIRVNAQLSLSILEKFCLKLHLKTAVLKLGFTLDDILIEGRDKTSRRAIMEVLALKRGDNILNLDINELKNR